MRYACFIAKNNTKILTKILFIQSCVKRIFFLNLKTGTSIVGCPNDLIFWSMRLPFTTIWTEQHSVTIKCENVKSLVNPDDDKAYQELQYEHLANHESKGLNFFDLFFSDFWF